MEIGETLCLACGLCCDGTLFGHVRLTEGDDAKKLKGLGLPVTVSRTRTPVIRFRQPCSVLCADRRCAVYADRPSQCRAFECGVFVAARSGRLELSKALRLVKLARRKAERVRQLLRALGDMDEHLSLNERFLKAQRRLESGAVTPAEADLFADLTQAVHALDLLAHESFYTRT